MIWLDGGEFAYWLSCIGKGLRLQPAQQACFNISCISKHGTLDKDNRGNNFLEDTGGIISYLRDNRFCELRPYWMDKMTLKRDETITMTWA